MKKHSPVSLLFVLFLSLTPAFAQDGATIRGSVTDPNGAAVAGAKGAAIHASTRQARDAVTDARWQYISDSFRQTLGAPRQISGGIRVTF